MGRRSSVQAPAAAVCPAFRSAFAVRVMSLNTWRAGFLHRHLIQGRRRFDANAVIMILGIASVLFVFRFNNKLKVTIVRNGRL